MVLRITDHIGVVQREAVFKNYEEVANVEVDKLLELLVPIKSI